MHLSEYQKSIVKAIQNGSIRNFVDYLLIEFQQVENLKTDFSLLLQRGIIIDQRKYDFKVRNTFLGLDNPAYANRLSDSIGLLLGLMKTLEDEGLIVVNIGTDAHFPAITFKNHAGQYEYDGDQMVNTLIFNYYNYRYYRTPSLDSFVVNGFLTSDELKAKHESNDRLKALKVTIWIAIISMILTVASNVINFIKKPTSPTEVKIVNVDSLKSFKDTVKLKLIR